MPVAARPNLLRTQSDQRSASIICCRQGEQRRGRLRHRPPSGSLPGIDVQVLLLTSPSPTTLTRGTRGRTTEILVKSAGYAIAGQVTMLPNMQAELKDACAAGLHRLPGSSTRCSGPASPSDVRAPYGSDLIDCDESRSRHTDLRGRSPLRSRLRHRPAVGPLCPRRPHCHLRRPQSAASTLHKPPKSWARSTSSNRRTARTADPHAPVG